MVSPLSPGKAWTAPLKGSLDGGWIDLNRKIRAAAVAAGVPLYKIAMELNISEVTLYRYLRTELPEEKKRAILAAIDKLRKDEEE